MIANSLHIVISSHLHKYSGGCETWLNYFLNGVMEQNRFSKIYIYHFAPLNYKISIPNEFSNNSLCQFIPLNINSSNKGDGFKNIFFFTLFTIKNVLRNYKKGDILVCIGSTYVALIGILLKNILRKSITLITWIRSIAVEELKLRGSKFANISRVLEKKLLGNSDIIITNGMDTTQVYKKLYPNYKTKINTIENSIDIKRFMQVDIPNFESEIISIAFIGRLSNTKGFQYYIEAVDKYFENNISYKKVIFNVYGHGEAEHLISENVSYKGKYLPENVIDILADNHVIVFLNDSKAAGGISHGILEALASGRLIIAWENRVHSQILNCNNAIMVEDKNVNELTSSFQSVVNEINYESFREKCYAAKLTAMDYSVEKHIKNFYDVIGN